MEDLAVKYRPRTFDDVVAQKYVKAILQNQLDTNDIKNAYLFTGGAGTGKTTCGRIFANELNHFKGKPIEIDAASNNGVEHAKVIIDESRYKTLDGEYKIFLIDECHMLTVQAWNALLKTLEEPPRGVVFIFCTTDAQKIPATIISRVQRYDFTRIPDVDVVSRLEYIIAQENLNNDKDYEFDEQALEFIAKLAQGGMRDAITKLEKVLGYSEVVSIDAVNNALGTADYSTYINLLNYIITNDSANCLQTINNIFRDGKDLKIAMRSFTDFTLDVCRYKLTETLEQTQIPEYMHEEVDDLVQGASYDLLLWCLEELNNTATVIKWEPNPKPIIDLQMLLLTKEEN